MASPSSLLPAIATRADLSALDLEGSLPSLPAAALEVVRVCSDPLGDIGELAGALSSDPTLAGQVLRVANAAHYYRGAPVTSLERAAMVLGMRALKVVALGFTLANELPRTGVAAGLDLHVYWHRSVLNAVVARSLSRTLGEAFDEEAFLCGLLSDIGKLALTHAAPTAYGAAIVFETDSAVAIGRFAAEAQRRLGLTAHDVGAVIAGVEEESREAAAMLSFELPDGVSYGALVEQARHLLVSMSVDAMLELEETSKTVEQLEHRLEEIEIRARADALTGLPNRAMLDSFLTQQAHQRIREELPGHLGVVLIGIDDFARFDELVGRGAEGVLRSVVGALSEAGRHSDVLARFGGEEFCLVVPHSTPDMLADAAERLRVAVERHEVHLSRGATWNVTASFGCAWVDDITAPGDVVKLIAAAGAELYRARQLGGNCVSSARAPVAVR